MKTSKHSCDYYYVLIQSELLLITMAFDNRILFVIYLFSYISFIMANKVLILAMHTLLLCRIAASVLFYNLLNNNVIMLSLYPFSSTSRFQLRCATTFSARMRSAFVLCGPTVISKIYHVIINSNQIHNEISDMV